MLDQTSVRQRPASVSYNRKNVLFKLLSFPEKTVWYGDLSHRLGWRGRMRGVGGSTGGPDVICVTE